MNYQLRKRATECLESRLLTRSVITVSLWSIRFDLRFSSREAMKLFYRGLGLGYWKALGVRLLVAIRPNGLQHAELKPQLKLNSRLIAVTPSDRLNFTAQCLLSIVWWTSCRILRPLLFVMASRKWAKIRKAWRTLGSEERSTTGSHIAEKFGNQTLETKALNLVESLSSPSAKPSAIRQTSKAAKFSFCLESENKEDK